MRGRGLPRHLLELPGRVRRHTRRVVLGRPEEPDEALPVLPAVLLRRLGRVQAAVLAARAGAARRRAADAHPQPGPPRRHPDPDEEDHDPAAARGARRAARDGQEARRDPRHPRPRRPRGRRDGAAQPGRQPAQRHARRRDRRRLLAAEQPRQRPRLPARPRRPQARLRREPRAAGRPRRGALPHRRLLLPCRPGAEVVRGAAREGALRDVQPRRDEAAPPAVRAHGGAARRGRVRRRRAHRARHDRRRGHDQADQPLDVPQGLRLARPRARGPRPPRGGDPLRPRPHPRHLARRSTAR